MKSLNTVVAMVTLGLSLFFVSCEQKSKSIETPSVATSENKIEVIDFYGTHRCITCKAIEKNAKYTVETFFPKEVEEGKVEFKTILVDDENNYDIAEKFGASGTALYLNVIKDGKENHIDLTDFAFMKGKDQELFSQELKKKIEEELKNI